MGKRTSTLNFQNKRSMSAKANKEDEISFPKGLYLLTIVILGIGGLLTGYVLYHTRIASLEICDSIDVGKSWKSLGTYLTKAAVAALIFASFANACLRIACKPSKRKLEKIEKEFDSIYTFIKNPNAKQLLLNKVHDHRYYLDSQISILPEKVWVPCIIHASGAILTLSIGYDQLLGLFTLAFYTPAFWLYWKVRKLCSLIENKIESDAQRFKITEITNAEVAAASRTTSSQPVEGN